jgi:hypothetical protein
MAMVPLIYQAVIDHVRVPAIARETPHAGVSIIP